MNTLNLNCGMAGRYKLAVRHADGSLKYETGWFDNLITDAGLNYIGDNTSWLSECRVGSGTSAPANSDTALASLVAVTTNTISSVDAAQSTSPYYGSLTNTYRFAEGAAAGNISEVGIGPPTSSTGPLFSRALVTDGSGNATTVTVLSDELLDVTYELRTIPPTSDVVTTVVDSGPAGTSHTVTVRAANVTSKNDWAIQTSSGGVMDFAGGFNVYAVYDGALGAVTAEPSGNFDFLGGETPVTDAYSNNSLERTAKLSLPPDEGNLAAGIAAIRIRTDKAQGGKWQIGFDPAIPKTNEDSLKFDLVLSWDRATI